MCSFLLSTGIGSMNEKLNPLTIQMWYVQMNLVNNAWFCALQSFMVVNTGRCRYQEKSLSLESR